jgi:hypothetical protein
MMDTNLRQEILNIKDAATLREVNQLVVDRIRMLNSRASWDFSPGDVVKFKDKRGFTVTGTIYRRVQGHGGKFDIDNCTDGRLWRVSASNLVLVDAKKAKGNA